MKKIWLAVLACLTFVCLTMAAGCSLLGDKTVLAFNEGYLQEITLGEPIMLDEYIDPSLTDDYTVILTCDETGQERDLKMLGQWTTDKPGTYTLTYTVNSGDYQGTISTKISVVVPKITWQYSRPTLVYRAGETMEFNLLKRNLNLLVKSYYSYDFYVKSVSFNEQREDLEGKTSYTFPQEGTYTFTFAVRTQDGQELSADQKITVRPEQVLADGAAEWMEENNITSHDYTYISSDGQVSLDSGYYNTNFLNDNVPYIAFNGEEGSGGYGVNTYLMVDFTGKNLPQVAFFCDEVTSSLTDGKNGIYFQNGTSLNDGKFWSDLDASRLTVFGPKKVSYAEFDNKGRLRANGSVADPCPMSYNALNESDSYRYIIGIEEATRNSITAHILLINMTTCERVYDYKDKYMTYSGPSGNINLDLSDDFFGGSIVLYGRYGIKTQLDKVYMPITGINSIYELDEAAAFKSSYKAQYELNTVVNIADYIDIPTTDYEFSVISPKGEVVEISENGSFRYAESGVYRLFFDPKQENVRASSITVRVLYDFTVEMEADYLEKEGVFIGIGDSGILTNKDKDYIKEGSQSIKYQTINGTDGKIHVYLSKNFMEFVFLSRAVQGISFEIYSEKAATFKLRNEGMTLVEDYIGEIPAETWTTMTISRDLCMKNFDIYKTKGYSIAFTLETEGNFFARESVYFDNLQIILDELPTIDSDAQAFLDANNMEAYGYKTITNDLKADLYAGTYQKEWWNLAGDDVPYIAYRGNYSTGSYVVVDFTGKDVPQLCFFAQDVTSSLSDGKTGLYIHTGMVKKNGDIVSEIDGGRITFLGPNKWQYCRPDAEGRVGRQYGTKAWAADNATKDDTGATMSPLSIRGLEDGVHYRYVAGIKTAKEENGKGRIVLELLLINLDTNTEVVRYEWSEATVGLYSLISGGSIVMYSRFNEAITLDKIYPIYEDVSSVYSIDKVSEILG